MCGNFKQGIIERENILEQRELRTPFFVYLPINYLIMENQEVTDENYFEVLAQKEPVGKKVLPQEEAATEIEDKDLEKLCEIALQTRNFEIELYWK